MAVLVTGGAGFIGSHLVRRLLRAGRRVIVLDPAAPGMMHEVLTTEELAAVTVVSGRADSLRDLSDAIRTHGVQRIAHLASILHPACDLNPATAIEVNIGGQIAVLEAARLWNLKKIVWTSSVAVFGEPALHTRLPVPNNAPHSPASIYGATKSFCELLTRHYRKQWHIDVTGLRLGLVYGPGRRRGATAFLNDVLSQLALGHSVRVPYADDVLDWQYVDDVASLLARCLDVDRTRTDVFNTRFDIRSVRAFCEYARQLFPQTRIACEPGTFGLVWQLDDTPLQQEIGFTPEYPMERGVLSVINHVRKHHGLAPISLQGAGPCPQDA